MRPLISIVVLCLLVVSARAQLHVAVDLRRLDKSDPQQLGLQLDRLAPSLALTLAAGVAYDGATLDGWAVLVFPAGTRLRQAEQQLEAAVGTDLAVVQAPERRDRLRHFVTRLSPAALRFPPDIGALSLERTLRNLPYVRLSMGDRGPPVHADDLALLVATPEALYTEPDHIFRTDALPTEPNDYDPALQWGLEEINAPLSWDCFRGDAQVVVAIVDTGIDLDHPDLTCNLWENDDPPNGVDSDGNYLVDDTRGWDIVDMDSEPQDEAGHGTRVAGIVGACTHNGTDVAGVNWHVSMMALRVFETLADGSDAFAPMSAVMEALKYAGEEGALVANCSWGGENEEVKSLYETMQDMPDVLFVCSAGNDAVNIDPGHTPHYPASFDLDNVLAVMAATRVGGVIDDLGSSSYGPSAVDMAAPGASILTTDLDGPPDTDNGTSFAAPFVTGAAALALSSSPCMGSERGADLKWALMDRTRAEAKLVGQSVTGGLVQIGFLAYCLHAPCGWHHGAPKGWPKRLPDVDPTLDDTPGPEPLPLPGPRPEPDPAALPAAERAVERGR